MKKPPPSCAASRVQTGPADKDADPATADANRLARVRRPRRVRPRRRAANR